MTTDGGHDEVSDHGIGEASDHGIGEARAFMRRLAGRDGRAVIERADAAVDDLDAAAAFVEQVGLDGLERAVEAADDPALRERGERALAAFRRFRAVSAGESPPDHFHTGHDIDLRDGDEAPTE